MKFCRSLFLIAILVSGALLINSCCDSADSTGPANHPPEQPTSPGPANGAIDQPINTTVDWASFDDDGDPVQYDIYFGTTDTPPRVAQAQSAAEYDPGILAYDQVYYWYILAYDAEDTTSSQLWSFTTIANQPPSNASSPNPGDNATDRPFDTRLRWTATDPEGDDLLYDVYFGDTTNPPAVATDHDTTYYNPGLLNALTTYHWKIVAKDGYGNESEGHLWSFTTLPPQNQPPVAPANPTPGDDVVDLPPVVVLNWMGEDPDDDQLTYDVFFGTNDDPPLVSNDRSETTFDPGRLAYSQTYYWRVIATDTENQFTSSPLWSFTTTQNRAPGAASDPVPANQVVNQPIDIDLEWSAMDPFNDPLTYDVYFGTTNNPPMVAENLAESTYDPGILDFEQVYFWKVITKDADGLTAESTIWTFTTTAEQNLPPNAPTGPDPANNAVDEDLDVDITWSCVDPDGDDLTFDVYFGTTDDPPLVVEDHDNNTYDPGTLGYGTTYYWKIVARDDNDLTSESRVWNFTTIPPRGDPPNVPANPTPAPNVANQPIDVDLAWTCSDPDFDPITYDVYFGVTDDPELVSEDQDETTWDPGLLNPEMTYYWKVVATDNFDLSTEGPVWRFSTAAQFTPDAVIINTDPAGATIYLDGRNTFMRTPATLTNVSAGDHHVRLYRLGRNEYNEEFTMVQGDHHIIDAALGDPQFPIPVFEIDNPVDNARADDNVIEVSGTVFLEDDLGNRMPYDGDNVILSLNGVDTELPTANGTFEQEISLKSGENSLRLRGTSAAGNTGTTDEISVFGTFGIPDIEITLLWNTPTADVDLHVWNPNGEHCSYEDRQISDGILDIDDTDGYGPETFTADEAIAGTYTVRINSYNLHDDDYTNATVYVRLYGELWQSFGPHRFIVEDRNGNNPDAWWEAVAFEIEEGLMGAEIKPVPLHLQGKILNDMRNLKHK